MATALAEPRTLWNLIDELGAVAGLMDVDVAQLTNDDFVGLGPILTVADGAGRAVVVALDVLQLYFDRILPRYLPALTSNVCPCFSGSIGGEARERSTGS
jgi:hypothetical protein